MAGETEEVTNATNIEIDDIVKARVALIEEKTEVVLNKIYESLDAVPYGIRWICRQIKLLALVIIDDLKSRCSLFIIFMGRNTFLMLMKTILHPLSVAFSC